MDGPLGALWYNFNFSWTWALYTLALGYRSQGSHHTPRSGPLLVVANHESYLDPLAVGFAVRRRVRFLARSSLFRPGLFGKYLLSAGCIPVDADGFAIEGLRASLEVLRKGRALLVFPEGERSADGQMQPFKPGIALLLRRAQVPVLPVGVAGAYESYPRKQLVPRLSPLFWPATGGVAASVGKVIPPQRYATMSREQILADLFAEVKAQVVVAEKLVRG